jgi:hypothetical protein
MSRIVRIVYVTINYINALVECNIELANEPYYTATQQQLCRLRLDRRPGPFATCPEIIVTRFRSERFPVTRVLV